MAKLTTSDLTSLTNQTSAITTINANMTLIETAVENTLSRDGTSPNAMGADLDMNSNDILNLQSLTVPTLIATTTLTVGNLVITSPVVSITTDKPTHYITVTINGTNYKLLLAEI